MPEDRNLIDASELGGLIGPWEVCPECGEFIQIGSWPRCGRGRFDHGKSVQLDPFATYWDDGLGMEISSLGDRWKAMRSGDFKLDYRDKQSPGWLSARRDRIEEQKKREARC